MAHLKGKRGNEPKISRRYRSTKRKIGSRRPHHSSERTHKYKVFRKGLRKRSFRFEIAILSCKISHHRVTLTRTFKTKSPPPTGATPQQEIFQRSPAFLLPFFRKDGRHCQASWTQHRQYILRTSIRPLPAAAVTFRRPGESPIKAQNTRKIKLSRSFPSPWGCKGATPP